MRMGKRLIFISFLAMIGVIISIQMAAAAYTVRTTGDGGTYDGYGPYQTGQGGEFTLVPNANLDWVLGNYSSNALYNTTSFGTAFQSFCLEHEEFIYPNTVHSATLSDAAIKGGVGAADPISIGTARLYYEFAKGMFNGQNDMPLYNYTGDTLRKVSAAALQQTIWWLEGEQTDLDDSNIFKSYILGLYTTAAEAMEDNNGEYSVMALNLFKDGVPYAQSQLVVTPIPASIWLIGTGLVGLAVIRRRFTT